MIASVACLVLCSAVHPRLALIVVVVSGLFAPGLTADEVVRIMAANISSGNLQSYDPGHGNRIFQGLDPDVALVQEMNVGENSAGEYRAWVDENFGTGFSYVVESGKNIPNGIVSRYPILESGVWDDPEITDREFVWARIDLPGDVPLWAISVHFKASTGSANVTRRDNQASALLDFIEGEVPAGDHLVIGGDLNTQNRTEICLDTLSQVVVTAGPWPVDQAGNGNTNAGRSRPYDWVMPGESLAAFSTPLTIGSSTFPHGLVFDSRGYLPLSEVAPVQAGDSDAAGMQHMAVMRAYLIPTNEAPVIAQQSPVTVTLSQNSHPNAFQLELTATDQDADAVTWSIFAEAAHGVATVAAPDESGTVAVSYRPETDYVGSDSFGVEVSDGKGGTDRRVVQVTIAKPAAYDAWTYQNFNPLIGEEEATVWGQDADPDGDGLPNLVEFAAGTNPKDAGFQGDLVSIHRGSDDEENAVFISYMIRMDGESPALDYQLQVSTDLKDGWMTLAAGTFAEVGEEDLGDGFKRRTIRLEDGTIPARFFRLRMTR